MRLLKVELTRLRWRRAVVVLLATCVVLPAVIWIAMVWSTRPVSEAEIRQAKQIVAEESSMNEDTIQECIENPEQFDLPPEEGTDEVCRSMFGGESDYRWYLTRQPLDIEAEREGTGAGVFTVLAALVMLLGTTFAGHDWNSGSMSNQLLFEPRRLRIWLAKAGAVMLVGAVTAAVVLAAWWGATYLVAEQRDLAVGAGTWDAVRNTQLRAVPLVAMSGLLGYALTMFFRSTVATLGIMFAVAVVAQVLVLAIVGEGAITWLLPTNVGAVLLNGIEYYDPGKGCTEPTLDGYIECGGMSTLSLAHGSVYLGVIAVVVVALSVWSFRRRDVP